MGDQVIDRFTAPPSEEEVAQFKTDHGIVGNSEARPTA